jgi:hypothetical protein
MGEFSFAIFHLLNPVPPTPAIRYTTRWAMVWWSPPPSRCVAAASGSEPVLRVAPSSDRSGPGRLAPVFVIAVLAPTFMWARTAPMLARVAETNAAAPSRSPANTRLSADRRIVQTPGASHPQRRAPLKRVPANRPGFDAPRVRDAPGRGRVFRRSTTVSSRPLLGSRACGRNFGGCSTSIAPRPVSATTPVIPSPQKVSHVPGRTHDRRAHARGMPALVGRRRAVASDVATRSGTASKACAAGTSSRGLGQSIVRCASACRRDRP